MFHDFESSRPKIIVVGKALRRSRVTNGSAPTDVALSSEHRICC